MLKASGLCELYILVVLYFGGPKSISSTTKTMNSVGFPVNSVQDFTIGAYNNDGFSS